MSLKRIDRSILSLALPAIVNNITVPLLGLCDTAVAGHLGDAASIGAVAVGAMMMNVIFWLCGFLRAGTSGLTAQAYGSGSAESLFAVLKQAITIGLCIALAVILLKTPLLKLFLYIISPQPSVEALASTYFNIGVWGAPAQLIVMACSGWFIGRQNTVLPMFVSVGMNVLNIVLSVTLVFLLKIGFAGIIWGTLTASWCGAIAILLCVRHVKIKLRKSASIRQSGSGTAITYRKFFGVSADLFLRSACIMSVSMAMTSVSARLGNLPLAANAVMTQFFLFFSYFMDGFAFAGEALVGKAVGACSHDELREAVKSLMRWGVWMALSFTLIYLVGSDPIVSLLTDDASVRSAVSQMNLWLTLLPAITVMAFIFDGIFIGWAKTRPLFVTTLIATAIFFSVIFLSHSATPSMALLWTGFEIYLFLRGALLMLIYRKIKMN